MIIVFYRSRARYAWLMHASRLSVFPLLLVPALALAAAPPARVDEILRRHAEHGIMSPAVAGAELAAAIDRPGRTVPEQSLYYFALGRHAAGAGQAATVQHARAELERLSKTGRCEPCEVQRLLIDGTVASRAKDTRTSREILSKLNGNEPADPVTLLYTHLFRANVLESWGEHDGSIAAAVEAARLAETLGRPSDQARALNRMVLANIGRRDLARAEALAKEGYALAERIGDFEQLVYLRGNQGLIHSIRGETRPQFDALTDVLRITSNKPVLRDARLVTQVNLSEYHLNQGEYRKAIEHALQGEQLARDIVNPVAGAVAMTNRAAALSRLGHVQDSIPLLHEAIAIGEKAGAKTYVANMYATLAVIQEEAGQFAAALTTTKKVLELRNALTQSQREDAVLELQEKYSAERKMREIERLSLENARKQAEVNARAWQQRMWAAVAVLLLLAAVMLVRWLRRIRVRNRLLEADNAVLANQSSHDPLTGAFNRRYCQMLMGQQEATLHGRSRARDYKACVGLMLLDIDFFKRINDQHGRAAGDAVLAAIARRLQALIREKDALVRWGGEQFLLMLPGTPGEGLKVVAERVLHAIASEPVEVDGVAVSVTISAGGISWPALPGQEWEDALHVADLALHVSKSRGRNRATCLMEIDEQASIERVHSDLAHAEELGEVRLDALIGPAIPAPATLARSDVSGPVASVPA